MSQILLLIFHDKTCLKIQTIKNKCEDIIKKIKIYYFIILIFCYNIKLLTYQIFEQNLINRVTMTSNCLLTS